MTRAQRIVLLIYCLLVVYCCVWIPRHVISPELGGVHLGYAWLWSGPTKSFGGPDMAAITLRLVAATALGTAAFLLARKWKAILSAAIIAGLGCAGILLYGCWMDRVTERRTQKIHGCAVAKVATAKCAPPEAEFQFCDAYALSDNPTAQQEDAVIAAAEKECTAEMEPKKKSAHEQIEEYKRQHGIKR